MNSLPDLYPLMFEPVYKDYIWGGDRIQRRYGRSVPPGIIAESWEITDRPEGMSVVVNGALAGRTLHNLIQDYGTALLGRERFHDTFPLLIKIIDAKQRLSVQVHPDEESAGKVGGEPKTEMWYVLDAEPDAVVYAGLKPDVDETAFREALNTGKVKDLLQSVPVSHGNVIYIPGGLVHAIGEGCLLLEIQQNSNTTYRVYDWERVGHDGKPRELHIDKAMRVIHWNDDNDAKAENVSHACDSIGELLNCPYFRIERIELSESLSCSMDGASFHVLFVEQGQSRIGVGEYHLDVKPGTSVFMPAGLGGYQLEGLNASSGLLRISLP